MIPLPRRYIIILLPLVLISTTYWIYSQKPRVLPQDAIPHAPWKYKPAPVARPPIKENFHPPLPSIPSKQHPLEKTPLLIGFTRNWPLLQQTVVSYLAAGWPASDIHVIENTGVMKSNELGRLTLQNPFYLDHKKLKDLGVNIIRTPTLLSFSQLQNFFLHTAIDNGWDTYFWGHMDAVVFGSDFYEKVVKIAKKQEGKWAAIWYAYDRLTLVNTEAYEAVGGFDTFIGYYNSDCDMHERLFMAGYEIRPNEEAGPVWDVAEAFEDLHIFFDGSDLRPKLDELHERKQRSVHGRNTWQAEQTGGQGEPYYRNITEPLERAMKDGKHIYALKWGHKWCNLRESGLTPEDAWRVEPDWTSFFDDHCR